MDVLAAIKTDAQAAELMEPAQGPFDDPANAAQAAAVRGPRLGQMWLDAADIQQHLPHVRVVGAIAVDRVRSAARRTRFSTHRRNRIDQWKQLRPVVCIGARQDGRERDAVAVADDVVFRALLAAIRRIGSGFFAPPTARTLALSTTARDQSIRLAACSRASSTSCSRCHTPAACQSRSRRQQVIPQPQPISCGRNSHGMPVRSTNRMPVNVARLSTGGRPPLGWGRGGGKSGATAAQRSSVTNGCAIAMSSMTPDCLNEGPNHDTVSLNVKGFVRRS